jgi:hypothetical protein
MENTVEKEVKLSELLASAFAEVNRSVATLTWNELTKPPLERSAGRVINDIQLLLRTKELEFLTHECDDKACPLSIMVKVLIKDETPPRSPSRETA